MEEMRAVIHVAEGFDPSATLRRFGAEVARNGDALYEVRFPSPLHGLAFTNASGPEQVLAVTGIHPIDGDGWADWSQSAPGEVEMSARLLPDPGTPSSTAIVYRYEDAWVWDENLPNADAAALSFLGLRELAGPPRELAAGRGQWAWKAVKIAWTSAGRLRDPRVQAVWWLTQRGWEQLRQHGYEQRARWEALEWERRTMINLVEIRRERLETGSEASRRKARQYYTTLDALIDANR